MLESIFKTMKANMEYLLFEGQEAVDDYDEDGDRIIVTHQNDEYTIHFERYKEDEDGEEILYAAQTFPYEELHEMDFEEFKKWVFVLSFCAQPIEQ